MGQLRKVIDYDTAKSPRSSSAETSPRADGDCTASASSLESRAPPSKCKTHFNLNPKAPAFAPSQTLMNENMDFFAAACPFQLDPAAPAFVIPSQALTTEQDFMAPPGLEGYNVPPAQQLPAQKKSTRQGKTSTNSHNRRGDTMKAQLEELQNEDPSAVFIARGINKLGFSSAKTLKAHFSRYGEVKEIYAPPSRVKSMHGYGEGRQTEAHWRLRAAPIGFIVMKSAEVVAEIFADGLEQNLNGVAIRLQPFARHACAKETASTDENELESSDAVEERGQTLRPSTGGA
mmetsp:Transcript_42538/g.74706  ORF Transcript_42538/g.74706 Transcript_42538/m.74706 type:complete len:289 (-) Transcript_42538:75-941(-)